MMPNAMHPDVSDRARETETIIAQADEWKALAAKIGCTCQGFDNERYAAFYSPDGNVWQIGPKTRAFIEAFDRDILAGQSAKPVAEGATDNGAPPLSDAERAEAIGRYATPVSDSPAIPEHLGRFGHHPDAQTDYECEIDALIGIAYERLTMGGHPDLEDRIGKAMDFQVLSRPGELRWLNQIFRGVREIYATKPAWVEWPEDKLATYQPTPASHTAPDAQDMAAFGASDAACYLYPGEDQQPERAAFCDRAADAEFLRDLAGRIFRNATPAMGFDQGDTDQLYSIAAALATPAPSDRGALECIRGMLAEYAGQPNACGDAFKVADAAIANQVDEQ